MVHYVTSYCLFFYVFIILCEAQATLLVFQRIVHRRFFTIFIEISCLSFCTESHHSSLGFWTASCHTLQTEKIFTEFRGTNMPSPRILLTIVGSTNIAKRRRPLLVSRTTLRGIFSFLGFGILTKKGFQAWICDCCFGVSMTANFPALQISFMILCKG